MIRKILHQSSVAMLCASAIFFIPAVVYADREVCYINNSKVYSLKVIPDKDYKYGSHSLTLPVNSGDKNQCFHIPAGFKLGLNVYVTGASCGTVVGSQVQTLSTGFENPQIGSGGGFLGAQTGPWAPKTISISGCENSKLCAAYDSDEIWRVILSDC